MLFLAPVLFFKTCLIPNISYAEDEERVQSFKIYPRNEDIILRLKTVEWMKGRPFNKWVLRMTDSTALPYNDRNKELYLLLFNILAYFFRSYSTIP